MSFQEISPSSSVSSRSGSPDTRATTPLAPFDSILHTYLPAIYVSISASSLSDSVLHILFENHSISNRIGLIIGKAIATDPPAAAVVQWKEQELQCPAVLYKFSLSYIPPESFASQSSPESFHATQHLSITAAGLRAILTLTLAEDFTLYILEKPAFTYLPLSLANPGSLALSVGGNIPTIEEWKKLWANWDLITLTMIPPTMLLQKPIDLRHKCLFYIGHIPTFLDMLFCKAVGSKPTEPRHFWNIFERGIDPRVDDPNHCHNHSEVPENDEDWPTLEAIIEFRDRVRQRLLALYDDLLSGKRALTRNIARMLVMTHEHEGFHVETILYMLIQRGGSGTLPPPDFAPPPWNILTFIWATVPSPPSTTVLIPSTTVTLGHDDFEADDLLKDGKANLGLIGHTFGWDNESPARLVGVKPFRAEWRCVTNGEFLKFWYKMKGSVVTPASWVLDGGEVKVRTLYGAVHMDIAKNWPVLTCYDDLARYAEWKGGRLPTEPELRLFLDLYDVGYEGGANIGFRNWHPIPGNMGTKTNGGRGSNGGVWEWTSTVFDAHEGFVPTKLFPGYSEDFFDSKHRIALGASFATIPRLAGRRTVRNFYQHNYPYPWVSARVVYDT